jgi:homoserine dehydrogenase
VIRDLHADVLIEASPSALTKPGPSIENIKAAMSTRKHVVSVNKAPLALAMPALLELARYNSVELRYSGTVGAGTPVLDTARKLAQGDRITKVRAILNGTTNFILWKMATEGTSYDSALAEAQKLGFAETDPSTDVDGVDTATKVVILANTVLAMSRGLGAAKATMSDVKIAGIRGIERSRIEAATRAGQAVKLIGEVDLGGERAGLSVSPQEVPAHGPLDVPRAVNAVQFTLESAGEVTLVGRGAGGPETATAIVRDLVDIWNTPGAHE